MIFVGENLWAIGAQKFFGQVWGNSGENPSHAENLPVPTRMLLKSPLIFSLIYLIFDNGAIKEICVKTVNGYVT